MGQMDPDGTLNSDPWVSLATITLDTPVVSKSNHRHRSAASGRSGEWRRFKAFEDALTFTARAALPSDWPDLAGDRPLQQRPVVAVVVYASTLLDAANLPKSITDGLEGVCFTNDASARVVSCVAVRSSRPAAVVVVAAFDPEASLETLTTATAALQRIAHDAFLALD